MTTQPLEQQTYLPDSADAVAEVLSFFKAHETSRGGQPDAHYFLSGVGEHEQVEIPASVYRLLLQVLQAMDAGKAVTVAPHSKLLTTQQAADLLGVSRPTVVKLIESGDLPAETPGTRRRMVKLDDLLTYRAKRREAQYEALMATAVDDYDEYDEGAEARESRLRRVRAEVAARRAAHPH
jgi:excisionase family DNA binding protein